MTNKKVILFIVFLATFTASVTFGVLPIRYPELGLDESWQQALVEATDSRRIFGDNIVFTYGPFHQAVTSEASDHLSALLTSRVLFASIWFGISVLVGLNNGLPSVLAIAISAALVSYWHPGPPGDAKFFLFSLITIISSHSMLVNKRQFLFPWRVVIVPVLFSTGVLLSTLVKLSFLGAAFPAMLSIYGLQILNFLRKPARKTFFHLLLSFLIPILIIYLLWGFFVNWSPQTILSYYSGLNLQLITGYADAMSYSFSALSLILVFLYWISILVNLICYGFLFLKLNNLGRTFPFSFSSEFCLSFFSIILLSWACFKAAFVRDDGIHLALAIMFLISFAVLLVGFGWDKLHNSFVNHNNLHLIVTFLPLMTIGIFNSLFYCYSPPNILSNTVKGLMDSSLLITGKGRALITRKRINRLKKIQSSIENYLIPAGKTADIMPWNITNLLANQLNYTPRPVPQSYTVYTDSLQKTNMNFFLSSPHRPEFVILEAKDIDEWLPIGLDLPALGAIKSRYLFSHRGSQGSLVFKLGSAKKLSERYCQFSNNTLEWNQEGIANWVSSDIFIPSNLSFYIVLKTDLKNSLPRSLLSAVYRPFPVMIEYLDAQGNIIDQFRFIPKAGKQIVAYPIIRNNNELFYFMTSNAPVAPLPPSSSSIRSFRLRTRSLGIPFRPSRFAIDFFC